MKVQTGSHSESVDFRAQQVLFVESKDSDGFDRKVLDALLRQNNLDIQVKALGSCNNIQNAAEALFHEHPHYYFLIDRDLHRDNDTVEKSWKNFPNPDSRNLLVWRRRELESYFIIPEYLAKSNYLRCSEDQLKEKILQVAQERIYLEAANIVLQKVRHKLVSGAGHRNFNKPFQNREDALNTLLELPHFEAKRNQVSNDLTQDALTELFDTVLSHLAEDQDALSYGKGNWIERIDGKQVFRAIQHDCFNLEKPRLQGPAAAITVALDLVKRDISDQPQDFQILIKRIREKILKSPLVTR